MAIDLDRVQARATYVRAQVAALRRIAGRMDAAGFVAEPDLPLAALHRLQTAIEALIDLAFHLSAKLAQRAPADAQEAFTILAGLDVLDPASLGRQRAMIRFRNRVVHGYLDVDHSQVFQMMSGADLADIEDVLARFESAARGAAASRTEGGPGA